MAEVSIKKKRIKNISIWVLFGIYIAMALVLIIKSCISGPASAAQSSQIGNIAAGVIDNIKGDSTEAIYPTSTSIENKSEININKNIGDTYEISVKTLPENATYKEINYSSSDENIAAVTNEGLISFLNEGEVTITVKNTIFDEKSADLKLNNKNLTDSITFNVLPIAIESVETTITYIEDNIVVNLNGEGNKYTLYRDVAYTINTKIYPENATNQSLDFVYDSSNFSINNDGRINIKSMSEDYEEIKITQNDVTYSTIYIKIIEIKNFIPFESIQFVADSKEVAVGESFSKSSLKIRLNSGESIPTYSDYDFSVISGSEYLSYISNNFKGLKEGEATIRVESATNASIYDDLIVKISEKALISFDLTINSKKSSFTGTEGSTYTLTPKNFNPTNSTPILCNYSKTYTSSDSSIAKITSNKVVALKEGDAVITCTITNINGEEAISSSINFHVDPKPQPVEPTEYTITSFTYTNNLNENKENGDAVDDFNIVFTNTSYDLSIKIPSSEFFGYTNKNSTTTDITSSVSNKNLSYEILSIYSKEDSSNEVTDKTEYIEQNGSTISIKKECSFTISVTHSSSNLTSSEVLTFYAINKISYVVKENDEEVLDLNSLIVGKNYTIEFNENYDFQINYNEASKSKNLSYVINDESIQFISNDEIDFEIIVSYKYNDFVSKTLQNSIKISINHIFVNELSLNIYKINDSEYTKIEPKINIENNKFIRVKKSDNLKFSYEINEDNTSSNISITSSDASIISINENSLKLNKTGEATITLKDSISGLEDNILVIVENVIEINSENPLTISGDGRFYSIDNENNILKLVNGHSIVLKINFTESSTYKTVTYSSSDETVAKFTGGVITPLKPGKTTLTLDFNDNITEFITSDNASKLGLQMTIKLEVSAQSVKDTVTNFFKIVRKSIGHFGAFFVAGIFSTIFFLLKFDKKKWFFSVPVNLVQGFALAGLTEIIQIFVPGRYGTMQDVGIDFLGFFLSALLVSIIIISTYFIKKAIQKKKKLKNNENNIN